MGRVCLIRFNPTSALPPSFGCAPFLSYCRAAPFDLLPICAISPLCVNSYSPLGSRGLSPSLHHGSGSCLHIPIAIIFWWGGSLFAPSGLCTVRLSKVCRCTCGPIRWLSAFQKASAPVCVAVRTHVLGASLREGKCPSTLSCCLRDGRVDKLGDAACRPSPRKNCYLC